MLGRAGVGIAYSFAALRARTTSTAQPLLYKHQLLGSCLINQNATGINPDTLIPVNKTPIQLKVLSLTLLLSGTAYAVNGGGPNGGIVQVPDSGSSAVLIGIAATACVLLARSRFKK